MYLVFTLMPGQLLQMIHIIPVVFVWCLWSADQLLLFVDWTETDFCVFLNCFVNDTYATHETCQGSGNV